MTTDSKTRVLGDFAAKEALEFLDELGDEEAVADLTRLIEDGSVDFTASNRLADAPEEFRRVYRYTEHAFGFIEPSTTIGGALAISDARNIVPDATLKGASLKLTLDRLRVADYPGSGEHNVIVQFTGRHQIKDSMEKEDLKFAQTYRVQEGQGAGIAGYPVFIGLRAPNEGVSFEVKTINVANKRDEALVSTFESDAVKHGLELISSANPVVGMLTDVATGVVGAILKRNRNVPVQDMFLGLDFSGVATRPQLRVGTYVAVQIPDSSVANWDWADWSYDRSLGRIIRSGTNELIPLNYLSFSVSKMSTTPTPVT